MENQNVTTEHEKPAEVEASAVDVLVMPEYLHRLDTDKPGLFLARLNKQVPMEAYEHMTKALETAVCEFAKGSRVVILGPEFEPAIMPDEDTMKRLGWVKVQKA